MTTRWFIALAVLLLLPTQARSIELTEAALEAAAHQLVQQTFASQGELDIHVGGMAPLGALQGTDAVIDARFMQTPRARGPVLVSLEMTSQGRRVAQRTVTVRVQVWQQVLVAARGIARHAAIEAHALQTQRLDIRDLADHAFTDPQQILGLRVKKPVRPGEVLLARTVERVPMIHRGEEVSIQVQVGGVTVAAVGTAQSDGAAGDSIDVKNNSSGKRLHCIVVAKGIVRVVEGASLRAGR